MRSYPWYIYPPIPRSSVRRILIRFPSLLCCLSCAKVGGCEDEGCFRIVDCVAFVFCRIELVAPSSEYDARDLFHDSGTHADTSGGRGRTPRQPLCQLIRHASIWSIRMVVPASRAASERTALIQTLQHTDTPTLRFSKTGTLHKPFSVLSRFPRVRCVTRCYVRQLTEAVYTSIAVLT